MTDLITQKYYTSINAIQTLSELYISRLKDPTYINGKRITQDDMKSLAFTFSDCIFEALSDYESMTKLLDDVSQLDSSSEKL